MAYYFTLPLLYLISYLPFPLLYLLSDGMYFLLYKVIGYRKEVVLTNLRNSFPEKSDAEIKAICDKFYRYFCDLILETIKTLTISPSTLEKHVKIEDESIFKKYFDAKQSIIVVMGHMGNWELAGARFSQSQYHKLNVIYHPLTNKKFNDLVVYMRTRLGNGLYAMNDSLRGMLRDKNEVTATAFIADQTPFPEGAYWTTFLNQDTPVFKGTEKLAMKFKYPVVYVSVKREKRGLYAISFEVLSETPKLCLENELSELHTRKLEVDIKAQPEIWLWTHKRWKYNRSK
jgi:Kdo2-lipid IVA lauroyltransferase/acyltransferase